MPAISFNQPSINTSANSVLDTPSNIMDVATAGFRGDQEAQGRIMERDNMAAQQQEKAQSRTLEGYKAMLKDPTNAQMTAQMYGIEMTPTLNEMLKQPQLLSNIVQAQEFATNMGIKNPKAMQKMMMAAAEQATKGAPFNPITLMQSIEGEDINAPMSEYQRRSLDLQEQRLNKPPSAKDTPLWKDPRLPVELQLQGQALIGQIQEGFMSPDDPKITEWSEAAKRATGQAGPSVPASPGAPAKPNLGQTPGIVPDSAGGGGLPPEQTGGRTFKHLWE